MQKLTTWALAIGAAIILGTSYLIDGASDADVAAATAADLEDAKAAARQARKERTLEAVLRGYSQLAGAKQ